ncbi:MAG: proline--tRNA ligase [bacterium]
MYWSKAFIPTLREDSKEAEVVSHNLMLRAGLIRKLAAGIYTFLPLGLRIMRKLEKIIREEMDKSGAQEILMPALIPKELWDETGRWDIYGPELMRVQDRGKRSFALGPTHEEVVTNLVHSEVHSYRQLPVTFYQIQTKFRDEIRPRFGIMRGREFSMKDAYSFDRDDKGAEESYQKAYEAYNRIFSRCGLNFRAVEADTGQIGGSFSHEFMVLANTGEDSIAVCPACDYAVNTNRTTDNVCPRCHKTLEVVKGIEVGHVFKLGLKYSKPIKAVFLDEDGKEKFIVMGCYGIGIGRTIAAAIEQNHDKDGIIWPMPLAPYHVIISLLDVFDETAKKMAERCYQDFTNNGIEVLFDDRNEKPGVKFKDADLIGIPVRVTIGAKRAANGEVEVRDRRTGETLVVKADDVSKTLNSKLEILNKLETRNSKQ